MRKKILLVSSLSTLAIAPAAVASCNVAFTANQAAKKYDLALSMLPLSSLNYIRYSSVAKILPSLVDGPFKDGVPEAIQQKFNLPPMKYKWYETSGTKGLDNFPPKPSDPKAQQNYREQLTSISESSNYYPLESYFTAGNVDTRNEGNRSIVSVVNANQLALSTRIALNQGLSKWSNGDEVSAQDYRDAAEYILDLSTGSQLLTSFLTLNIKGAKAFIDAQHEYQKAFKTPYINPFGRRRYIYDQSLKMYLQDPSGKYLDFNKVERKIFDVQLKTKKVDGIEYVTDQLGNILVDEKNKKLTVADERKFVDKIKQASLNLGIYTGQRFLDFSNEFIENQLNLIINKDVKIFDKNHKLQETDITIQTEIDGKVISKKIRLIPNPNFDPRQKVDWREKSGQYKPYAYDRFDIRYEYDETTPPSLNTVVNNLSSSVNLIPINRRFVEMEAGGILNFGNKKEHFLTSGPFKIESLELGAQGNIVLVKDERYYSEHVIPRKTIIYFNDNPIVLINMFQTNQLSAADMPSSMHLQMWSDPKFKKYLVKSAGFGTIGMQFNLDPNTQASKYLRNQNLRNAIAYSIDRNDMLNLVGWQASFPVINWTAFNTSRTRKGVPLEAFFEDVKVKAKNNLEFPIQNYAFVDHLAKSFTFENVRRTDKMFDFETARFYMELFRKENPDVKEINLKYIYDGSKEKERAGISLQNQVKKAFGYLEKQGFKININLKSFPANAYADERAKGNFDITYFNFDYFGTSYDGYIKVFLETDEINLKNSKTLGFQTNPSGAWTYKNYFDNFNSKLDQNAKRLIDKYQITKQQALQIIDYVKQAYSSYIEVRNSGNYNETLFNKFLFEFDNINQINKGFLEKLYSVREWQQIYNTTNLSDIIKRLQDQLTKIIKLKTQINNLIQGNSTDIQQNFNTIFKYISIFETEDFARMRLNIPQLHWDKIKELSSSLDVKDSTGKMVKETKNERTDRINRFFSFNFTQQEKADNWTENEIFKLIVSFEKIIRDSNPVIPLMEVDTKWQISHVGGVSSLFRFSLQFAYDVTKPPEPGLPRTIGKG